MLVYLRKFKYIEKPTKLSYMLFFVTMYASVTQLGPLQATYLGLI